MGNLSQLGENHALVAANLAKKYGPVFQVRLGNHGIRIEGNVDDKMLGEITHVEREISNFRSTSNNWADYIPALRLLPGGSDKPLEYKKRRASYM